jgi:glycosidase
MLKILRYWASMGIDGFRCDMVEMTPVEFWNWAVAKIKEEFPGIIFIGEIYQPHIYRSFIKEGHFDYLYDKVGLYDTLRAVMNGQVSANNISYALQSTSDIRGNMLTFLENHDEQRIASDFFAAKAERALAALIVSATTGTEPFMLYAGQELGERGMDKEGYSGVDGRTTIFDYWSVDTLRRWKGNGDYSGELLTEEEKALQNFYSNLLNLCNKEKALAEGTYYGLQYANPHSDRYDSNHIFSYLRGEGDELLLIITNFSNNDKECDVIVPEEAFAFFGATYNDAPQKAKELLSGKVVEVSFNPYEPTTVTVPANSGVILKFKV